jgi:4-hydroxy-2-oxoheptanedioate aldolase
MLPGALGTEILSTTGVDWLSIDLQHGQIGEEEMRPMVQAAAIRGTPVLVRVVWNDPGAIMRALDTGADGVIVPMVNSAGDARAAVAACRFPPTGIRSWGPVRASLAQPDFSPALANEQVFCMVMVETSEAVENLDEILDEPGIDGIFVGARDLAISESGETAGDSARFEEMIAVVGERCRSRGLVAGTFCAGPEDALRWDRLGYRMIAITTDAAVLAAGIAQAVETAHALDQEEVRR